MRPFWIGFALVAALTGQFALAGFVVIALLVTKPRRRS